MSGASIRNAFRLANALLAGETLSAKQVADALELKAVANARTYMTSAGQTEGFELLKGPLRIRLSRSGRAGATDEVAIASCFGASLATVFEGSRYENGMRDALEFVASASPDPKKFSELTRKFFFVRRGGESALPAKAVLLDLLVRSVVRSRCVWIEYEAADGRKTASTVEPLSLAVYDHQLYLVARRVDDGEHRLYRFSRLRDVKARGEFSYPSRGAYDPAQMFTDTFGVRIGEKRARETVRLRLSPHWWRYAQNHRWHHSQKNDAVAGTDVIRLDVKICEEVIGWVLSFGGDAEVIGPLWLRKRVAAAAKNMAKRHVQPAKATATRGARARAKQPTTVSRRRPR